MKKQIPVSWLHLWTLLLPPPSFNLPLFRGGILLPKYVQKERNRLVKIPYALCSYQSLILFAMRPSGHEGTLSIEPLRRKVQVSSGSYPPPPTELFTGLPIPIEMKLVASPQLLVPGCYLPL